MTPRIDINDLAVQALPPNYRLPKFEIMSRALLSPLDTLNRIFIDYQYGDAFTDWYSPTFAYSKGDKTKTLFGVYVSTQDGNIGNDPLDNKSTYWYKILPCYIGATERSKYTANKIIFEYALNRYLGTTFRDYTDDLYTPNSDIYIETDSPTVTSFVMYPDSASSSDMYPGFSTGYLLEPPVYSASSSYAFTIYVPAAFYASLGTTAEQIIRSFADKLCVTGVTYTIATY